MTKQKIVRKPKNIKERKKKKVTLVDKRKMKGSY